MEVVNTFFEENSQHPCFELENGKILKPYFNANGAVKWMTEEEFKQHKIERMKEEEKPFWKKIFN